jgi:hypothetical protein
MVAKLVNKPVCSLLESCIRTSHQTGGYHCSPELTQVHETSIPITFFHPWKPSVLKISTNYTALLFSNSFNDKFVNCTYICIALTCLPLHNTEYAIMKFTVLLPLQAVEMGVKVTGKHRRVNFLI